MDFYDRIKIAAEIGFDAVEFWDPVGKDTKRIGKLAAENNIAISVCTLNAPWNNRINGPLREVIENTRRSLELAKHMGCASLIALAGDV
jgi:hydroxypyruvate isomerase